MLVIIVAICVLFAMWLMLGYWAGRRRSDASFREQEIDRKAYDRGWHDGFGACTEVDRLHHQMEGDEHEEWMN